MSTATKSQMTFGDLLAGLRRSIRRYVALEGVALVVVVLGIAFWLSLALDYGFELPRVARGALLAASLAAAAVATARFVVLRMTHAFRQRGLALVLERRFPELNDRLITAVEAAESREVAAPLTLAMLQKTSVEAAELSSRVQLSRVFDFRPLARAGAAALALLASIAVVAVAGGEVLPTWLRRNVLLADELYRRDTDLHVVVLADPGERAMEFRAEPVEGATRLVYRHPRGADFTFLATVVEGMVVPEQVQFTYRNVDHSGRGGDVLTRIGERQFRQRIAGLHESIWLWVAGGDFSTRDAFLVQVVEPPQVDRIVLDCLYPEYTGLNRRDEPSGSPVRQPVPVLGTQVALPNGTDLVLNAAVNKPLREVRVQCDAWELRLSRSDAQLLRSSQAERQGDLSGAPPAGTAIDPDGRGFQVPLRLFSAAPGVADPGAPLPIAGDSVLRFTLHDEDDVIGAEPARLTIDVIHDQPPRVETRLRGIGGAVTRQATIPVVGDIQDPQDGSVRYGVTDDYGVVEGRFEYRVEREGSEAAEPSWRKAALANPADGGRNLAVAERFALLPLDLALGARLLLKVVAVDGDHLTGPHVTAGQAFQFLIVSDDELLAQISAKELNIRRRFEQIIEEVKQSRKELLLARARLDEARARTGSAPGESGAGELPESLATAASAAVTAVERAIGGLRKNANETQSIEEEFRDIRDELENNAIPDVKPMLVRLDEGIISPLHSINTVDYNGLDDALVLLLQALEAEVAPNSRFDEAVERSNVTIERLEAVLAQMLKLETVNEMLQMLRDIIKAQEELQEKTRSERKKKLIEGLQ
ncbi:MAG: hypothetical protein ACT4QC_00840 [Planctomycetaceae bacterium]